MRAYYTIGGVSPIHQLAGLFEEHKDELEYDAYHAQECVRSSLTVERNVDNFPQAKAFFDRITAFLWDVIWQDIEGGYSVCGCANEDDEEIEDEEGRDYKEWEEEYNDGKTP